MLVIHGIWAHRALHIWAEDSALPPQAPPRAGRPSRAPRAHPFAAPPDAVADALADALTGADAGELPRKAVDDEITLRLPSTQAGPLASPELLIPLVTVAAGTGDAAPSARPRPSLAGWRVPVLVFEPAVAVPLLTSLAELPPGDIVVSGSIGYLAAVARFAADLAARGRVLPVLTGEDGGFAARWRPVLSAADARYARELAAAVPPACRAAADTGLASTGAGAAAGPLLADMLDVLTDMSVRTRLPGALLPARSGRRPARIAVSERMLAALTGPHPLVEVADKANEREAQDLTAAFADWLARAALPAGAVRTCFRLVEPPVEESSAEVPFPAEPRDGEPPAVAAAADAWQVEFSLQSAEDPSLMVPAADVWDGAGYGWLAGVLPQRTGHPEEELLAGLGAAARLFPALDGALREAAPAQVALDTAGALDFLRETGPLLSGAGFGVLMPDWARKARLGLKLTARSASGSSASARDSQFGLPDLVNFRYDVALGDDVLSAAELAELARLKVPLVRVRGQWVELDDRHLKAALKFLERKQSGAMTAAEVLAVAMANDGASELPLTEVDADGWLGDLLSGRADERLAPMETPDGFRGTLRPYQQRGLSWLSFLGRLGVGAVLADDMGLGKTVQLLSLLWAQRVGHAAVPDHSAGPTLLICPMSLTGNWQREAERFTPDLAVYVHHGADRLSGAELTQALAGADLVITTYQTATRDLDELAPVTWARVVCDEAQAIKNHLSRQAKAVRALPAASRIALTGTPVENQLSELWSIMDFANPGMLGSAKSFRDAYAVPIERHGSGGAARRLRQVTQPFVLRRLKTDRSIISDLPAKQEMKVWCNLTAEQASLYEATVNDMLAR